MYYGERFHKCNPRFGGGGDGSVNVTAKNNTGVARSSSITISGGGVTKTIPINQEAGKPHYTWTMFNTNPEVTIENLRPELGTEVPNNVLEAHLIVPQNGLIDIIIRISGEIGLVRAKADQEGFGVVTSVQGGNIVTCAIDNVWNFGGGLEITVEAVYAGETPLKFYIMISCQME